MMYDQIQTAAAHIREAYKGEMPKIAVILGSGLAGLADALEDAAVFPYGDLPGFPVTTVIGHTGKLYIGKLEGVPLICMQGRVHGYEGHDQQMLGFPTRVLAALGVETLFITNASGSLDVDAGPGSLMMITDHINFSGMNPLVGVNDDRLGPRFPDMGDAWNKKLRKKLAKVAEKLDIKLHKGVYIGVKGPNFETPAEIRAFRMWGAGCVGMSTIPEVLTANHAGMKVVGVASITNYAAGMVDEVLNHVDTLEYAAKAAVNLERLIRAFVKEIGA